MLWGVNNVAHNDIKSTNVMVSEDGILSLIDFGGVTIGEVSVVWLATDVPES